MCKNEVNKGFEVFLISYVHKPCKWYLTEIISKILINVTVPLFVAVVEIMKFTADLQCRRKALLATTIWNKIFISLTLADSQKIDF